MVDFILTLEVSLFLIFSILLFKKDRLLGLYFFFIFVYSIFPQVGYAYIPELSSLIGAYFGADVWQEASIFIIFSGCSLFVVLYFFSEKIVLLFRSTPIFIHVAEQKGNSARQLSMLLLFALIFLQYVLLLNNHSDLSWETVQNEDSGFLTVIYVFLIKLSVGTNLALYSTVRHENCKRNIIKVKLLTVFSFLSFFIFTSKIGDRTDVVALVIAIIVFETVQTKIKLKHFLKISLLAAAAITFLNIVEMTRDENAGIEGDTLTKILYKDYFAPAHILFATINYNFVSPTEVIVSNFSNSLILFNYPYLQATVTDMFRPGVATRSAGYAFYSFAEGYIFCGFYGFIYNAFIIGFGLCWWRSMAKTNSYRFNCFLLAIMGSMLINLVRGQSSYYIKYLYTYIVPCTLIYLAVSQQRITFISKHHFKKKLFH